MIIKSFLFTSALFFGFIMNSNAQNTSKKSEKEFIVWKGVRLYGMHTANEIDIPVDSLCGGEWIVPGKAKTLDELDESELELILEKTKKYNCNVIIVDLKDEFKVQENQKSIYFLGYYMNFKD